MPPPKIRIRGARSSIPAGSLIGRVKGGRVGELQVLKPSDLARLGIGSSAAQARVSNLAGFTFFEEGLMLDHELLGQGAWAHATSFVSGAAGDVITADLAATSDAFLEMWAPDTFGVYYKAGTIEIAAGTKTGVVVWTPSLLLPKGKVLKLYGPTPPDATLAGVGGTVVGTKS